jgi:hypothetical protein
MKKTTAFFFAALLSIRGGAAEELTSAFIAEHGDAVVARVVYEGNKRTRDSTLGELTGISAGMLLSDIDPEAAKQSLMKSGIFSAADISASVDAGKAVVTVSIREKWTFIPVPSLSFGSDGWSAGLSVLEFNFLGLRKTLVVSGSASNLGLDGVVAYSDPRFLHSKSSFRAFASYGHASREAQYMDGASYASFDETTADGGLSVQYPSEGKLFAELDLTLRYTGMGSEAATLYGLYEDSLVLIPAIGINYDGRKNVGYREAGPSASATYTHGFRVEGFPAYDSLEASAEASLDAFLGGFLEIGAIGRYGDRSFQALGSLSGPGYRTLPQGYTYSPKNATAYANFMLPFIKAGWSVMEIGPFYEGGTYTTGLAGDTTEFFHGPGLCYRLYLRDVAIPAVEVGAAYNLPAGKFVVSVNIGLSI